MHHYIAYFSLLASLFVTIYFVWDENAKVDECQSVIATMTSVVRLNDAAAEWKKQSKHKDVVPSVDDLIDAGLIPHNILPSMELAQPITLADKEAFLGGKPYATAAIEMPFYKKHLMLFPSCLLAGQPRK
jgi:hypothetical protein